MSMPPNLRDVSACCGNCDNYVLEDDDENEDIYTMKCETHDYIIEHYAYLCDDYKNE
jgi:hypothetical protein